MTDVADARLAEIDVYCENLQAVIRDDSPQQRPIEGEEFAEINT